MPKTDFLANFTIACCCCILFAVYCSINLTPAWDDATGFQVFDSYFDVEGKVAPDRLDHIRNVLIPRSAKAWAANLSVEIFSRPEETNKNNSSPLFSEAIADVFDSRAELGKHHVMRVSFCPRNVVADSDSDEKSNRLFCVCDQEMSEKIIQSMQIFSSSSSSDSDSKSTTLDCVPEDERIKYETDNRESVPDRKQVAILLRYVSQLKAEKIENEAFDRLVVRLRHYYQSNAGIDALLHSIMFHHELALEEGPIDSRHVRTIVQPRLPPALQKRSLFLNFIVAEKDARWIHDLAKDPQASALTHAPFLFPLFLIFVSCIVRMIKGLVMVVVIGLKKHEKKLINK